MEKAAAELQEAGDRAEKIARLRAEAASKLAEIEALPKEGARAARRRLWR